MFKYQSIKGGGGTFTCPLKYTILLYFSIGWFKERYLKLPVSRTDPLQGKCKYGGLPPPIIIPVFIDNSLYLPGRTPKKYQEFVTYSGYSFYSLFFIISSTRNLANNQILLFLLLAFRRNFYALQKSITQIIKVEKSSVKIIVNNPHIINIEILFPCLILIIQFFSSLKNWVSIQC